MTFLKFIYSFFLKRF